MATVFTIGHSTRDLAEFSRVLQAHDIRLLEDIRAFPMSRRHPHFNREHLELWLPEIGCDYVWEKEMGGRRGNQMPPEQSPNIALRSPAFRNYADYMLSEKFQQAIERLVERGQKANTAIMCAEQLYFRCHRMLVSDYLAAGGHTVLHILDEKPPKAPRSDQRSASGRRPPCLSRRLPPLGFRPISERFTLPKPPTSAWPRPTISGTKATSASGSP